MIKRYNKDIVATLYESHYHYGVAALINSLTHSSFEGLVCVGYKNSLPKWINQLKKNEQFYSVNDKISVEFISLNVGMHLGYYKPYFLKNILNLFVEAERVYYFDPDIVINAKWDFFKDWTTYGISLCSDVCFSFLHYNHPWRKVWMKDFQTLSNSQNLSLQYYVNSGFIGLNRIDSLILDRWISVTDIYIKMGKNVHLFEKDDSSSSYKGDQDLLNAAMTLTSEIEYSIIGKEGMGFSMPAYLMSHAVGDVVKPWKKNFITNVILKGAKPTIAEVDYLKYCNGPIKPFKDYQLFLKKLNILFAKILCRIWSK